jgi:DNA polymerase-4
VIEATILHVDMDAFYASVEVLLRPELAGQPVIVGGAGPRGVVASCSYEARAYGVRSAMPSTQARRLCPAAVFLPGRFDVYHEYSRRIHEVFHAFTPTVEGIALDEAFLDVAGARRLFGPPGHIAQAIRDRLHAELGLWSSVGVASSKLLAKLASEAAKPRASLSGPVLGPGVVEVAPGSELDFLHPLPVEALWGVGPATSRRLTRFGVVTIGDLAAIPRASLIAALGQAHGAALHDLAWARDPRPVEPDRETKSIGHEETYRHDLDEPDRLGQEVVRMADAVASRLRAAGLAGRTVTIKVRFADFLTITRSATGNRPLDTGPEIARLAGELLAQVDVARGVRLLGVSVANLTADAARQLSLDELSTTDAPASWSDAAEAVDAVRARFGDDAVGPATLVTGGECPRPTEQTEPSEPSERPEPSASSEKHKRAGLRIKRIGDTQWGPSG